jgi:hypothetical protein
VKTIDGICEQALIEFPATNPFEVITSAFSYGNYVHDLGEKHLIMKALDERENGTQSFAILEG